MKNIIWDSQTKGSKSKLVCPMTSCKCTHHYCAAHFIIKDTKAIIKWIKPTRMRLITLLD